MKRQFAIITCVACLGMAKGFALAQEVSDEEINERFTLIDGDILVPNENVSGTYRARLWPGGRVPYSFSSQVTPDNRQRMLEAMAEWEAVSGARFIPRTDQDDYVLILHSEESNSSAVGRVGGQQYLKIRNWDRKFVIVHELGHALGLYHEQSREDRSTACNGRPCILIKEENISQTACSGGPCNFNSTVRPPHGGEFGPYDFDSVMHYSQCAFSKNENCPIGGGETIIVPAPNEEWQDIIGHVSHLSTGDMLTMDFLYPGTRECPGKIVSSNPEFKAIDARVPSDSSGEVFGWDEFEIEFDGDASGLTPSDFLIGTTTGSTPRIKNLVIAGGRVNIMLDRTMAAGSWLSIMIKPCNDGLQVGFLPGDVNGNRTTLPSDLLVLIDCLNGLRECVEHAGDIDRSGAVAPADIIALTDLLNGAGPFASWSGRSLPTQPDAWVAGVRPAIGLIGIPVPGEFEVTVCRNNEGPSSIVVPLSVTIGDPVATFNNLESINVGRLSCATASIFVPTPFVSFACGGAPEYPVRACVNLASDANNSNNCKADVLEIAPAFYDLEFTVLPESTKACINEQICWNIQICNNGTITSHQTSARTGICPDPGSDYAPCVGGGRLSRS